jgi:hypothetical protein
MTTKNGTKKNGKISQLDAAAAVLKRTKQPMNCKDLVEYMTTKKLWVSPKGKTPAATLSAALQREIKVKGKESRFVKADRGMFALAR